MAMTGGRVGGTREGVGRGRDGSKPGVSGRVVGERGEHETPIERYSLVAEMHISSPPTLSSSPY